MRTTPLDMLSWIEEQCYPVIVQVVQQPGGDYYVLEIYDDWRE